MLYLIQNCIDAFATLEYWDILAIGIQFFLSNSLKNCGPMYFSIYTNMASGRVSLFFKTRYIISLIIYLPFTMPLKKFIFYFFKYT